MKSTSRESKNIRVPCQANFHYLPAALANQGGPSWLELSKCDAHVPEGLEGQSGGPQACQSDLGAGEAHGADHPECHHQHAQHNQGTRPSQQGFRKGRSCLTNWISFYDKVTHCIDEGKRLWLLNVWTSVKSLMLFLTTFQLQLLDQKLLSFQCSSLLESVEAKICLKCKLTELHFSFKAAIVWKRKRKYFLYWIYKLKSMHNKILLPFTFDLLISFQRKGSLRKVIAQVKDWKRMC